MITTDGRLSRLGTLPVAVLFRAFFAQFFTTESDNADAHLRRTVASVLAFLILPNIFLVVQLAPAYQFTLLRAAAHGTPELVDQFLIALGGVFVAFSMVTTGFIAAFLWDTLGFDRRDAMVLGPLPLRARTIVTSKVAALSALLLGTALGTNLVTAVPFALATADRTDGPGPVAHFTAHLTATVAAAVFVFAVTVVMRGAIGVIAGARVAAAAGSALQFVFVSALLSVIVLIQEVSPATLATLDPELLRWVPPVWYLGVFEQGLELTRPRFGLLAGYALPATGLAAAAAIVVSAVGFRREMRLALTPAASSGPLGNARLSRSVARALAGRDRIARATADFILLTLARSRSLRGPLAMNAAVGVAIIVFALWRVATGFESLLRPRTAVLWIPLVMAYWLVIGLRASFFMPSELPASWVFRFNGPDRTRAYWSAIRASIVVFVAPRMLAIVALLVPLVGLRVAAWHALVALALTALLAEVIALTIRHVPFTREYLAGHARLRTRWPLYLIGMFAFAYWPVQAELRLLGSPAGLVRMIGFVAVLVACCEVVGRLTAPRWSWQAHDPDDDDSPAVLDLANTLPARSS